MRADELLRQRVSRLMEDRRLTQTALAALVGKSQSWLSRRLTGNQTFRIQDLDQLAAVFRISVPELFFDQYGQWDRRSKQDRRKGDRRRDQQRIFDPHVELTPEISRLSFPPHDDDGEVA